MNDAVIDGNYNVARNSACEHVAVTYIHNVCKMGVTPELIVDSTILLYQ